MFLIKCYDEQDPDINPLLGKATATDNCTPSGFITITYEDDIIPGTCDTRYTINRTWKATDACGNERTSVQTINVGDTEGPIVTMPDFSVACPSDIPSAYATIAVFEADGGTAIDGCGAVTISILFSNEISNGLQDKPGYCPDNVERTYRFTDPCGNHTDVIQTIVIDDECGCSPCDNNTEFGWVDFLGRPNGDTTFYDVRRTGKCCADDEWWTQSGAKNLRCVSYNVRIDDDAVGVQILMEHGATPDVKDWRVDCQEVTLQEGNIICLPSGGFHLFTYCKQGNNPNDVHFGSVPGIIVSDDITTRVDCSGQINTEGNFTNPVWTSISPGATGAWDHYLDLTDPYNPVFTPDENSPAEIQYKVCADLGTYVCDAFGSNCDTITVYVKEAIEIELNIDPSMICIDNPLTLIADVSPASSYYTWEWFTGTGAIGSPFSTGTSVSFTPPVELGWYSVKVTDHDPTGLMCNTAVYDFQIEADVTEASIFSPADELTIECNDPTAPQQIQDWLATATAENDDGTPLPVSNNYTGISMECGTVLPVEFSATDICGNTGTAIRNINVIDVTPPVLNAAQPGSSDCTTLDPNDNPGYIAWLANRGGATATDECDNDLTWTDDHLTATWTGTPANQEITITWTITDDCNNGVQTSATYSIIDDEPPTITCPGNATETAAANNCSKTLDAVTDPTMNDNCSIPSLTWEMTGATTGTGSGTVTGESFNVGVTTVTYTATDATGLTATCQFTVTIVDVTPPNITIDGCTDIEEEAAPNNCSKVPETLQDPIYTDDCWPLAELDLTYVISGATTKSGSGSVVGITFNVGVSTVVYTVTDPDGNYATCSFTVTIVDVTPPYIQINGCEDVTETSGPNDCFIIPASINDPVYSDDCWPVSDLVLTYTITGATTGSGTGSVVGTTFNVGVSNVEYTVEDPDGNKATCSFTVTILRENIPPAVINCPSSPSAVFASSGICEAPVTLDAPTVTDPCATITYTVENDYNFTGNASDSYPVGITTVIWTITDNSNRVTTCEQTVEVIDDQDPIISCPGDVEDLITDGGCTLIGSSIPDPTISDNCDIESLTYELSGATVASSPAAGLNYASSATFNVGITTVTYTITDVNGLTNTCSFTVWIKNLNAPQFSVDCSTATDVAANAAAGICEAPVTVPGPTINNPCNEVYTITNDSPYKTSDTNASGTYPVGTTTFTWTITDASGNVFTCTQNVVITDTQAPTLTCPANVEDLITNGGCDLVSSNIGDPVYNDNCGIESLTWEMTGATVNTSPATGINNVKIESFSVGITTVTYTITDVNGLTNTCSFTVWIKNLNAPQFSVDCSTATDVAANAAAGICEAPVTVPGPTINNPCNEVYTITNDSPYKTSDTNASGTYPVGTTTFTWTITDASGNVFTCTQNVVVTDTQVPTLTCPANVEDLITNGGCDLVSSNIGDPVYNDNCGIESLTMGNDRCNCEYKPGNRNQ